jgi:hypothetical protein
MRMKRSIFVVVLALFCTVLGLPGCGPKMAPPPYTAEQIREANPPGTVYRWKLEAVGQPTMIRVMEFTSGGTTEKAEVRNRLLDEAGRDAQPASVDRAPWDDLRRHGEFPISALKVEPGTIEVPAGKFDVMVYTVSAPNGDITRLYFAKNFAGPPVLFYTDRRGARVMTSTLIERTMPGQTAPSVGTGAADGGGYLDSGPPRAEDAGARAVSD